MEKVFNDFMKDYNMINSKIKLKYNHTFRVADLCEYITGSMNFSKEGVKLARACGLFHDLGRFPQARDFNTFDDQKSIDHADLGFNIYEDRIKEKLDFSAEQKRILGKAILFHNKYSIAYNLTPYEDLYLRITRDADKIDILYLAPEWDVLKNPCDEPISEDCYNSFFKHECSKTSDEKNQNDRILRYFSFIWDLNFYSSINYVASSCLIDKIYEKTNKEIFKPIYDEVKAYFKLCEDKKDSDIYKKYYENQHRFIEKQKEEQEKVLERIKYGNKI